MLTFVSQAAETYLKIQESHTPTAPKMIHSLTVPSNLDATAYSTSTRGAAPRQVAFLTDAVMCGSSAPPTL
jgi:trimethylamine:corrinoid methyltransferase-like protein